MIGNFDPKSSTAIEGNTPVAETTGTATTTIEVVKGAFERERGFLWALACLRREPVLDDFRGLSYREASIKATAICRAGAETGKTILASRYLNGLVAVMQQLSRIEDMAMQESEFNTCQ